MPGEVVAARDGSLAHQHGADVEVGAAALLMQERGVERGEPVHAAHPRSRVHGRKTAANSPATARQIGHMLSSSA
ncbi:MAG TPA: hypothetical protein VGJ32_12735 [Solirubrobacteraceae bacterium]|jgi:hypothetical protein